VHLIKFGKGTGTAGGKGTGTTGGAGTGTAPGTIYKTIQNTKNIERHKNAYDTSHDRSDFFNSGDPDEKWPGGARARARNIPGSVEDARPYFLEIQSTAGEAEKFFNHFQSNGWKVGGRAPMKDWRAAARNWVINAKKFAYEPATPQPRPGKLNTGPKNYAEPL
jgi:hypothetical protein